MKCVCPASEMWAKQRGAGRVRFLLAECAATRHKVKIPWNAVELNHPFACLHTANRVRELQRFGWEKLQLRTAQIFPFVTFTFLATWRKTFVDEEVQEWVKLWIHQRPISFYKTGIDRLVSQWDKCINTSDNYFGIKQIPLSLCSGCSVFIWLPLIAFHDENAIWYKLVL